jgi:hypothetical protein
VLAVALLAGCAADAPGPASESPQGAERTAAPDSAARSDAHDQHGWFIDRADATGLRFVHFNGMSGRFYFPEIMPPGVGLLDYDNDGDLDAFLVQGEMMGPGRTLSDALFKPVGPRPLKGRLYRNDLQIAADGTRTLWFTDVTDSSGIDARGHGMGVAAADIDNDGWVDLFLTYLGLNRLYHNNGDGTFTDVSTSSGIDDPGWGISASFVDYDRDGWLDLYVGNYVRYEFAADRTCTVLSDRRSYCGPEHYDRQTDRLYHNRGNGTFVDATATAFIGSQPFGPALGVATADFDNDGWMDIYVANDGRENLLWMNQRDGTFRNLGLLSGAAVNEHGKPEASMGVDAGDFDNDGDEDLVMTHLPTEGHNLYVNGGSGMFKDESAGSRLHGHSMGYTGWGTAWIDFDNDGWLDILAVHGALHFKPGQRDDPFPFDERNLLLRNSRDGQFANVTDEAGAAFKVLEVGRGAAFGDVDNDGDMDVLIANLNGPVRLLVNNIGSRSHWMGLRLAGPGGRDMLGARVEIKPREGPSLWRRARSDGSYASANDPRVLIGLGTATTAPTVRVRWPSGEFEEWSGVSIDRWTTLKEGTGRRR